MVLVLMMLMLMLLVMLMLVVARGPAVLSGLRAGQAFPPLVGRQEVVAVLGLGDA